jgi:Trp operon repressor
VACLTVDQSSAALKRSEAIFYRVLEKFIEHGRVKYIPETQLDMVLKYFVETERMDMIDRLAIYFDLTRIDRSIVVQCLLQNNLVVSLAHICTQGNEIEFVTPFVKFWGASENHRLRNEPEFAMAYAFRALWYVKLCLQRNWILKEYSFAKYATMITILSQHFLSEKILLSLLSLRPSDCLNTLSYYFTIENSQIINASDTKLPSSRIEDWIDRREGNEKVEELLSAIFGYLKKALKESVEERMSLFLSNIIIYKTVRFTEDKYYHILSTLISHYSFCKDLGYGLEDKMLE